MTHDAMGWLYVILAWLPVLLAWVFLWWYVERRLARQVQVELTKLKHPGRVASLAQAREDAS